MVSSIALALPLLGAHCSSSAAHGNGACGAGGETTCGALLDRTTTRRSGRVDAAPGAGHPSGIARLRSLGVDPTKGDLRDIYRTVAPATVIIRTENGHGTGVLIDVERRWVLTNDHVVHDGRLVNFVRQVNVEFGALDAEGVIQPDGHERVGTVLLTDPSRDLAVVQVADLPSDAHAISTSQDAPVPGMPVATVGHGNLGLAWAIKGGEVAGIGHLGEQLAVLVGGCSGDRTMSAHPDRTAVCAQLAAGDLPTMRVVQSSAEISPGDSGGPLVNAAGQLVGLNSFGRRNDTGQWASFHVHRSEVVAMLQEVGTTPQYFGPRLRGPEDAMMHVELLDIDLDGRDDALLLLHSDGTWSYLLDLDQDTSAAALEGSPAEVFARGGLDVDVVARIEEGRHSVFHDFDGDGRFERLYDADGAAYENRPDGSVSRLESDDSTTPYAIERYTGGARSRLATRSGELDPAAVYGPLPAGFAAATVSDIDEDGQADALVTDEGFVAADLNQDRLSTMTREGLLQALRSARPGLELSIIPSPVSGSWVWYDRDADGTLETGLRSGGMGAVVRAVQRTPDGQLSERPDLVGQLAYDPALFSANVERARAIMEAEIIAPAIRLSTESGPWPMPNAGRFEGVDFSGLRVSPANAELARATVVVAQGDTHALWLFDLDHDSPVNADEDIYLETLARDGRMDAEMAIVGTAAGNWVFYDHRGDSGWDTVIFRAMGDWDSVNAWTVEGGTIRVAEALRGPTLVRPSLFSGQPMQRLRTLAEEIFRAQFVEGAAAGE